MKNSEIKMKELLQQKALEYARNHSSAPDKETPDWIITDYLAGAKEILDNPELYDLVKGDKYEEAANDFKEVSESHKSLVRLLDIIINGNDAAKQASLCDLVSQIKDEYPKLRKENKELQEKITLLGTGITPKPA
jgi:hypothetical protein